jgi:hypothetical protein
LNFRSVILSPCLCRSLDRGTLELRAESQTNTRDLFCAAFRGVKLANKDGFFGTSDPFIVVSRYAVALQAFQDPARE